MDIRKILADLHAEREQVNEVILILERLEQGMKRRKDFPTELGLQGPESGKRKRTASPATRAKTNHEPKKPVVKAKAAGN